MKRDYQHGFGLVSIVIIIVILGLVAGLGWIFLQNRGGSTDQGQANGNAETAEYVEWSFDGNSWQADAEPPMCKEPLQLKSPVDLQKASDVLYPGQIRGGDFKPHGGIGSTIVGDNAIEVSTVMDAYLYRGARYIEQGEIQYLFDFLAPCGIMYRFDHLHTLTPGFMDYADKLPPVKNNDSRTTTFSDHPFIQEGSQVATRVGFVNTKNTSFDFGVYDLRKQNEASKTEPYRNDHLRIGDKEQSFFAICWLDFLSGNDSQAIKALPARGVEGKTSDYCKT